MIIRLTYIFEQQKLTPVIDARVIKNTNNNSFTIQHTEVRIGWPTITTPKLQEGEDPMIN